MTFVKCPNCETVFNVNTDPIEKNYKIPKRIAESVLSYHYDPFNKTEDFKSDVLDWIYDPQSLGIKPQSREKFLSSHEIYSKDDWEKILELKEKRLNIIRLYLISTQLRDINIEVEE